ncbi:hypothetical protein Poli38472_014279 [Pythium oligandrum]|uniref:JmjC domain-containing protein n=1 Tax=Pythium oligandrum TaxID=41045 RepID=A0A8K1CIQ1_PYTOL|nr:hypothetical protein Poli38472_014279 [Pythium oligandrum]|eukprot:TMW64162.1 hypothetical protein Poli38472_014279 [Pythium oligandrum]
MFRQPALASSAFAGLHDELLAYWTLFCDTKELLALAEVNSVFHVFAREEPLWMLHCLRVHNGDFTFHQTWRLTTFFPRPERVPATMPTFAPMQIRNFGSDFLYRRWCRSHMSLKHFVPPPPEDPYARRVKRIDVNDMTYQEYFEQNSRVPFVMQNAIAKWKAATEWTMDKLVARFSDPPVCHRVTHNLDTTHDKSTDINFSDYQKYLTQQHDETPLYIFDPRFGEKMPSLLGDYNVADLKFFREDLLKTPAVSTAPSTDGKKKKPGCIDPDFRWIVIGPERSGAPWHTDPARTSAWNALLQGHKRWAIYPPGCPPPGIKVGKNAAGREHALNMTSLSWYLHVYPTLAPHERPYEIVQGPGDVIYVPSGWWHLVLNLDETIAVTQNFVDSHNLPMFLKDLLDDQHDEALRSLQQSLRVKRPETFDVFRLAQIPRMHGYLDDGLYVSSFGLLHHWKGHLKTVLKRHHLSYAELRKQAPIRSLTARANPTFALGDEFVVKFYSELNEDWGEFDLDAYLSPPFDDETASDTEHSSKKRKTGVLQPHQLKTYMSLRYAMEECYRIETATYRMLMGDNVPSGLAEMIPKLFHASHLLDVSEVDDADGEGTMWRWPYAVIEFKKGLTNLNKLTARGGATVESWQRLASWLNHEFVPRFHAVPIDKELRGVYGHSKAQWDWYAHYLLRRRKQAMTFHMQEDAIPPQLINTLEAFLLPATHDVIVDNVLPPWALDGTEPPVLLHGDLTDENVLGTLPSKANSTLQTRNKPKERVDVGIRELLASVDCAKYIPLLVDQEELTCETLRMLTETHLTDLGLPLGPRLAILNAVAHAQGASIGASDVVAVEEEEEQDDWEMCSDNSSDSCSDDEDDDGENLYFLTETQIEALRTKRQSRFYGAYEWTPTQVIDFADSKTGDPLYDLVAILFGALHCDRDLWRVTMAAPYWQSYLRKEQAARGVDAVTLGRVLGERFLRLVLLHPSRSVQGLFHFLPEANRFMAWSDVAQFVFGNVFVPQS